MKNTKAILILLICILLCSTSFVHAKDSIEASFIENPFSDVPNNAPYINAVLWAKTQGITDGTSPKTFSPNNTCTRGQVVTFLWRAAGQPLPANTTNPFTDVNQNDYFYTPVLWAVENGITDGTSPTTFSPEKTCIEAQILTFLWRSKGSPATDANGTPAVSYSNLYFEGALAWAYNELLISNTFDPYVPSPRSNIVQYLYINSGSPVIVNTASSMNKALYNVDRITSESITPTVIVDEKGIKVTAEKIVYEKGYYPYLKVTYENDTTYDLVFKFERETLNGYSVDSFAYTRVTAGNKAKDDIVLSFDNYLVMPPIDAITDYSFVVKCVHDSTNDTVYESDVITLKTSAYGTVGNNDIDKGAVIYNQDGILIGIQGFERKTTFVADSVWLYIENNTESNIGVRVDNAVTNGYMADLYSLLNVNKGTKAEGRFYMNPGYDPEEIGTLSELKFDISIINLDNTDIWETETIANIGTLIMHLY